MAWQQGASTDLSLVVVTWNSAAVIDGLARSLPDGLEGIEAVDVLFVDNHSADDTMSLVRSSLPSAKRVQLDTNRGYAAGINEGVARTVDGEVLVLNPDIRLRAGSVKRMLETLHANPDVGIVVPRIERPSGELINSLRRSPSLLRTLGDNLIGGRIAGRVGILGEVVRDRRAYERATSAAWATGAAMLISRSCLDAVGPWEESFFLYSEETDFALRAQDRGFRLVLEPAATFEHLGGESRVSKRLYAMLVCNRIRLVARRQGSIVAAMHWFLILLGESIRSVRGDPVRREAVAALLRRRRRPQEIRDQPLLRRF